MYVQLGFSGSLPSKDELARIENADASEVYSADSVLLGKYYIENRTIISLEEIPDEIIYALVATEDARFFKHSGIDLKAWIRVFLRTVLLQDAGGGGGSTLSQQLAKNLYPRSAYRIMSIPVNKVRELYIARRLEKVYSKEELISLYLNTVPFGGNIYGIEVASNTFFGKSVGDLKLEEAAVLVGMLKANTTYNPVRNRERSKARRNVVLAQMSKYGYLKSSLLDSLQQLALITHFQKDNTHKGLAPYLRAQLKKEVEAFIEGYNTENNTNYNISSDGLKIFTTLDSRLQRHAEDAVSKHMKELQQKFHQHWKNRKPWGQDENLMFLVRQSNRYKKMKAAGVTEKEILKAFDQERKIKVFTWDGGSTTKSMSALDSIKHYYTMLQAGFLVADPYKGKVLAWVGGIDHTYFQYDHVLSKRQVGSTFKPIVFASALENGFEPCDYFHNRLVTYTDHEDWQPENADGEYGGLYTMQGAITNSVNSVTVDIAMRNGISEVRTLANQMGIESNIPEVPSIALGTGEASLMEMIKVYGTLANKGKRTETFYLDRIIDAEGKILFDSRSQEEEKEIQVLERENAEILTHLLTAVVDSGTARRLRYSYGLRGSIAGKTGTTQSHADGWFIGFTPRFVAGSWVGGSYPGARFRTLKLGQGANTALPIWGLFAKAVYQDPAFQRWQRYEFAPLDPQTYDRLHCPPYVESEDEIEHLASNNTDDSFQEAIDNIFSTLRNSRSQKEGNSRPNYDLEQRRALERKRAQQQREKRRKKKSRKKRQKDFWDNLFKKKN